jgi:hypothetical protein
MQIGPEIPISFSTIDRPVEAFVTPPNDPLAGILMDHLPKDCIEIKGTLGEKSFHYSYSLQKDRISMKGEFDSIPFQCSGTYAGQVDLQGTLGANSLSSTITPDVQGPRNTSQAGLVEVREKIDINPFNGTIQIGGSLGQDKLSETIRASEDGSRILDSGSIGSAAIEREVTAFNGGFMIKGSIGELPFEEYIVAGSAPSRK